MAKRAKSVAEILKQSKWSGADVGTLLIYNLIDSLQNAEKGNRNPAPILPPEKFNFMLRSIDTTEQQTYIRYLGLNDWLIYSQSVALLNVGRINNIVGKIVNIFETASAVEDEYAFIDKIDEIGCAKTVNPATYMDLHRGLDCYTPLNARYREHIQGLKSQMNSLEESYYFVLGYNKCVDLIAEYIGLPDLSIFKLENSKLCNPVATLNEKIRVLKTKIESHKYKNEEAAQRKLKVLKYQFFKPINVMSFTIPSSTIEKAKKLVHDDLGVFEIGRPAGLSFSDLLTVRR
jgi:hypothetical protein